MTDTIKHTRIFKLWRDRVLNDEEWEHGKIRQWCKAVYNLATNGTAGGFTTILTPEEASELVDMFEAKYPGQFDGPRVTEEQAALGRQWLATTGKRFGLENDHKPADITHFTFVDGHEVDYATHSRPAYITPVYVAFWPDGTVLRYWATPWQDHADMEWRWGHT